MTYLTLDQSLIAIACICVLGYALGRVQRVIREAVEEYEKEGK